jgi:PAS domain S-box-containing protein
MRKVLAPSFRLPKGRPGPEPHPGSDEAELLRYRELVDRLLEEMPAGFVSVDADLRIGFVNRTAERVWGLSREQLLGRGLWEVFPDAATPEVVDAMARLARDREPVEFEMHYAPTDRWIRVHAFATADGFSTFFLDVTERRLAEMERQAAEARYRTIVEEVPAITYLVDAFDGGVRFVSPQVKTILGYSPEEWMLNRGTWDSRVHPDDADGVLAEYARCRADGIAFEAEYRMLARDGRVVWFHDRAEPVLDDQGDTALMHGVMVDVTAHRAAQETIRRKESILAASGFAAERLLGSPSWEGVVPEVLARLGQACGVDRVDLLEVRVDGDDVRVWDRAEWCAPGVGSLAGVVTDLPVPWLREWMPALRPGEAVVATSDPRPGPFRFPASVGYRSSAIAPLFVEGALWGLLSLGDADDAREWTPAELEAVAGCAATVAAAMTRQRSDAALRKSEERFRRLADEAPDVIFRYRLRPEPGVDYVSPAVTEVVGYTPEEVQADPQLMFKLIHPEDIAKLNEMVDDPDPSHTLRWIARDGHLVWTEQRSSNILDERGAVVAIEGIARDVTDRVTAEENLRASFQALSRSNEERRQLLARLVKAQEDERQRVAADIHDDSIQIMTAVGMRLAMLRGRAGEEFDRVLATAEETVALAIQRLRHLLFELHPLSLDSSGLVAAIDDHVRYLQKDEDAPEATIDDGLVAEPPRESRTLLYRIAQEALNNVRKHARATHVWISLRSEAGGVRVSIRDDGAGFAVEPSGGGIVPGHVGIPSMRERAQLAGGWFRIDSEPGMGTTVAYWIPEIVAEGDDPVPGGAGDP